jgi:hypothetical protein
MASPTVLDITSLAHACLSHMRDEEAVLVKKLELVTRTREALRDRDTDLMLATAGELETHAQREQELAAARTQLNELIAKTLRTSVEAATIGAVIRETPSPMRAQLEDGRARLQDLAETLDKLNRANVALIAQFNEILGCVLEQLTGQTPARRYGRSGRMDAIDTTSTFQTDY